MAGLQQYMHRWPDFERVRLVSITVDPEHDTSERLREYAAAHHADDARWKFLTGDRSAIWDISRNGFKLPVSEGAADSTSPITHSAQFILVDSRLRVRGYYDSQSDHGCAELLKDLRDVLSEQPAENSGPVHVAVPKDVFDSPWMAERAARQIAARNELPVFHDFQFEDRVDASGINFVCQPVDDVARHYRFNHYDHACGISVADVDGDGLSDIYFVNQVGGNQLWRNAGDGRFEDFTSEAGVDLAGRVGVSASFADTDNDGDPDLFVTTTRFGNAFFENDGTGRFRDVTAAAGLDYSGHSSSAEFFDYDRDGLLDLLVTNVGVFTTDETAVSQDRGGQGTPYYLGMKDTTAGHLFPERSERSILYHNEGGNRFADTSEETGLVDPGWTGDATPIDINNDGWIDVYLLNMQGTDECFVNLEGTRFERRTEQFFTNSVWGGMGVKSFDYNNDGLMDLFVTNMHADMWEPKQDINGPREKDKTPYGAVPDSYLNSRFPPSGNIQGNALYRNEGNGTYRDVSRELNAENYWPWGPSIGDLNADGYLDLFIASCMNYPFRYHVNSLLLNDGGRRFHDAEFILGVEPRRGGRTAVPWFELDCEGADASHELCQGRTGQLVVWGALGTRSSVIFDLEGDGDLDIVTNDFGSPPMVLISNRAEREPRINSLQIRLKGKRSNREGLGAVVTVVAGDRTFSQVHDGQSGYLSQSALPLYFGLGGASMVDRITVQWPGGAKQTLEGPIESNQQLWIEEQVTSPSG
jgi:hypothetical protein